MLTTRATDPSWAVCAASRIVRVVDAVRLREGELAAKSTVEQDTLLTDRRSNADTQYVGPAHSAIGCSSVIAAACSLDRSAICRPDTSSAPAVDVRCSGPPR